jgi:phosphonoacetate hydrolase
MTEESIDRIRVNGRSYRKPTARTVVICFDGCDPRYISHGLSAGLLPNISKIVSEGFFAIADAAMPTFTNPNNMSIVTGAPPKVHGISGNYYLDKATGREVMNEATLEENGIDEVERLVGRPTPDMYSPDLSLFVLDAGIRLVETRRAEVLYLSLSDMVQHSAGPGEELANSFNREVDQRVGRMLELDAVVAIVADHGMTDKCAPDGQPQVVYLEQALNDQFGPSSVRVICPITDPFVKHHGALGSFVRVYATGSVPAQTLMDAAARIPGVALVLDGASAAARYEMPPEREGDFFAVADTYTVIGSRPDEHDLTGLTGHRLRSHGGLSEQPVPFMLSRPLNATYRAIGKDRRLRNFDIFDFALNGTV